LLKFREGEVVTGKFRGLGVDRVLVQELFDDVRDDYRLNGRSSIGSLDSRLKSNLRPFFDAVRAADVTTALVKRYVGDRIEAGATNATVNRELEILKRALRLGAECDPPKVSYVPHIAKLVENNVRKGFLDDEGYLRLRQELPDYLKPMLVVGYHIGNRLGELKALEWRQVELHHMRITLDPGTTKNDEARTLPVYGEMAQWLSMQKAIRDTRFPQCPYVFFQDDGSPVGEFRKTWAKACKNAGVEGLHFHDLRRSAVRNMNRAGVTDKVAMQISGHKTRSVYDRYNITSDLDISEAATKMENRFNTRMGTLQGTPPEGPQPASDVPASKLLN
jgi:integrase